MNERANAARALGILKEEIAWFKMAEKKALIKNEPFLFFVFPLLSEFLFVSFSLRGGKLSEISRKSERLFVKRGASDPKKKTRAKLERRATKI